MTLCVASSSCSSLNALTALRALRVLRILRLMRYLESLRKVMGVLMAAMSSFAAIGLLTLLFWVLFSIIGLHVFGTLKLDDDPYHDGFPNYHSFINSMVATFDILTFEDVEEDMMVLTRASGMGSALFFVAWMILGR